MSGRRYESIDILRGIALFGVLAVNLVTEFRTSIFAQFVPAPDEPRLIDRIVTGFVHYGLELKAFAVFSFLFGVGLAIQFERLAGTGQPLYWLTRRLLVLLGFGMVHLLLIWNGDILTEYALAGLLVLPLLRTSRRVQAVAAGALLLLYLALPALPMPVSWPEPALVAHHVQQANRIYSAGSWWQVMHFSLRELPYILPLHVHIFPRTLGLFVLGMLAWRSGIFSDAARSKAAILAWAWFFGLLGMLMSCMEAGVLSKLTPLCLGLGFTAMVVYAVEFTSARAFLRGFAAIGSMAFTNYIVQSLVFAFVFFGWGLGQFGHWRPAPVFAFGLVVYAAQMRLSRVWLRRYRFGPLEWLWRTLMYGRRQAMKRAAAR